MTEDNKSFICEHDAMRRKCVHCELDEVYADLNAKTAENASLITTIGSLQRKVFIRDRIITAQEGHIETVNAYLESQKEEIADWERQYAALLERKRRLEQYVPADQIAVLHETGGSPDLINIVESQDRTIKTYEEVQQGWIDSHARNFKEIESLKAITELAVKGLQEVASGKDWSHIMAKKAEVILEKIERLQNE